ncbi:MAG: HAMP domain-containing sensor histidine kinase [Chloroflexota bacterium]
MSVQQLLDRIRPAWIQRVTRNLARGSDVRENFQQQIERFYEMLAQAAATGNPAWLDPILNEWADSQTLTDLEQGEDNISSLLNRMIALTHEVARESLNEREALDLLTAVVPLYTYGLERIARREMDNRVGFISNQLVEMRQKLERLDRSKSNFISVAAHELKTPLTLIEGYASMMRDIVTQFDQNGEIDPLLKGVNTGIQRLRQIIDDMIDVSLIDNNLLSLNFQPIWVSHILNLLRRELADSVGDRRQTLEIRAFTGSEEWIYADPERLYQALRNVLANAVKFTPDGGRITVDGRLLPGFVEITVTDTGIGITPEDQARIFEKFGTLGRADLHSSGKTKFKGGGPGLGLSITRGVIEAHGGTIWVESEGYDEKKLPGSTFHILLPIRTEAADPRIAKLFGDLSRATQETRNTQETNGKEDPSTDAPAA